MGNTRGGWRMVVGLGVALGFLVAGLVAPTAAGAQTLRPGPGRGYYSVPDRSHTNERHWRRDGWSHERWGHDGWRRDGWDHRGYYGSRRPWPYRYGWAPAPAYRPGQWIWNGWGWIWAPGY